MEGALGIRGTRFRWQALAVGAAVAMMAAVLSAVPAAAARAVRRRSVSAVPLPAEGFRAVGSDGGVFDFGTNRYLGSLPGERVVPAAPVVGMAPTPDGRGYWLVGSDGGVFTFGDAGYFGSLGGVRLAAPIVGVAATPDGRGYWLVGSDGGVFAFGDAGYFGSLGGVNLHAPIVGVAATPDGGGYWLVGADGGVFAFGDAGYFGSLGGVHLDAPIVGIASAFSGVGSSGRHPGYWLVARDGGVFAFGAPYLGSLPSKGVHVSDVVGLTPTVDNQGYWIARSDGAVYTFGSAPFIGDFQTQIAAEGHPGGTLAAPWVGLSTVAPPGATPTGPVPVVALAYGPGTGPSERDGSTATAKVTVELNGTADADAPVTVEVAGANGQTLHGNTDSTGTVFVPYIGSATGVDSLTATSGTGQSGALTIDWSAPASLYSGTQLTLSPSTSGPDIVHQSQTLTATLTTSAGHPLADMFVPWSVTGANTASGTAVTNASGQATFSYSGTAAGADTVTATFRAGSVAVRSNPATVTWQAPTGPLAVVSLGPVTGDFYAENSQTTTFQATPEAKPAFAQTFPDIEFNPPAGAVPGDTSGVTPATRPFTDVTTDGLGNADGYTVAQSNGYQAGVGTLASFDAVLQGSFQVSRPGSQTFELFRSDGFILGVGGGATATGNIDVNPPAGGVTAFAGLPVLASDNQVNTGLGPDPITVDFPSAGSYPFELDYLSRSAATGSGQMSLALTTQSNTAGLEVSFGYADNTTTPAAGTFPSPWSGSSGVTFVGGTGAYDSGAIQIQNTTSTPIPLDGVTVDIGSQHYDPWTGQSLTVPASGSLVLAGSGSSFDTSESAAPQPSTLPPGSGFAFGTYASGFACCNAAGPVGMAQNPQGDLYVVDHPDQSLYRFGPSGGVAGPSNLVATYTGTPFGLAYSADYRHLYMTLNSDGTVVEIDPSTGAILRTVASGLAGPGGLALDPVTGDLVVSQGGGGGTLWFVADPTGASPTVTSYSYGSSIDGIAVGPHGTVYGDICCGDGFWMIDGPGSSTPGQVIKEVQSGQLGGTDGIALIPPAPGQTSPTVVQNSNNGVIYEIQDPLSANPTISTIYTGGTRGDFVTVGADGCLYATQSSTVLKGTAADGACPFIPFGCPGVSTVPQVHILVNGQVSTYQDTGLALTSGGVDGDHCGGSNESVQWTPAGATPPSGPPVPPSGSLRLSPWAIGDRSVGTSVTVEVQAMTATGQPAPAGTPVTLTVSGPNAATLSAITTAIGLATFSYTGNNTGMDSLVATTSGGAGPAEVSNTLTVGWYAPVPATPAPAGGVTGLSPPSITGLSPGSGADLTAATVPVSAVVTATGSPVASWSAAIAPAGGGTATPVGSGSGAPPPTLGSITTTGMTSGQYQITVTATSVAGGSSSVTETVSVQVPAPGPPPAISSLGPAAGGVATTPIPITAAIAAPSGQTITAWAVTYQLGSAAAPVTLASGTGTPPSTLATFDPTVLPDGTYVITVSATASGGGTQSASTSVAVTGNLKPGRYTATYPDVSVPVDGFQMAVDRTYDSLDKTTGAFGVGWNLSIGNFKVTTNGPLGSGGWSQYDPMCYYALCTTAYRSSEPHYVTVTWPDGHDEVFDFTPTGGTSLFPSVGPGFTAQPGTATTSTLSASEPIAGMTAGGDLIDYAGNAYSPTVFTLTTAFGEVLTLSTVTGLVSMQDPNGNSLTVDSSGVHASDGQSLTFSRDSSGRITSVTTPTGAVYSYTYDSAGDLTTVTPPSPTSPDTYTYDSNHDLLSQSGPGAPVLSMTYDPSGRLVKLTDAAGNSRTITNDVGQRQVIVADPNGELTTVYTYDPAGNLIEEDRSASATTLVGKWTYDGLGDQTSYTDPGGDTSTAAFNSQGEQTSITDATGRTYSFTYNSLGEVTGVVLPDGVSGGTYTYDANGNMTSQQQASGQLTTYTYNSLGELTSQVDPLGATTSFGYNAQGSLASVTGPGAASESYTTDESGRVTSVTNGTGATTSFAYDANGHLTSVTDANNRTWTYSYNPAGQQVSTSDPAGATTTFQYTTTGELASVTNADGQTVSYSYDADHNLTAIALPNGQDLSYTYDPFGRLVAAADPAGTVSIGYLPSGHVASETTNYGPGGPDVNLSYTTDPSGLVTGITAPFGTTNFSYDINGSLSQASGPPGTYQFGYTPSGLMSSTTGPGVLASALQYNAADQLTGVTNNGAAGTLLQLAYSYGPSGQAASFSEGSVTTSYGYDGAGQLTSVGSPVAGQSTTYTYDPAGNRLTAGSTSYAYNSDEEMTVAGSTSYTYNGEGEPTKSTDSATGAVTTYQWNALGELTSIGLPDGSSETFTYNALGRRASETVGGKTSYYVYAGDQLAAVYDGTSPAQSFTVAPGQPAPLAVTENGASYSTLTDGMGTTLALVAPSGQAAGVYSYSPFGSPVSSTGVPSPFGFTGQTAVPSTGLNYDNARYYAPATGRLLSPDPALAGNPVSSPLPAPPPLPAQPGLATGQAPASDYSYLSTSYLDPLTSQFLSPASSSPTPSLTYNPYAYSDNSPTRLADPSGQLPGPVNKCLAILAVVSVVAGASASGPTPVGMDATTPAGQYMCHVDDIGRDLIEVRKKIQEADELGQALREEEMTPYLFESVEG